MIIISLLKKEKKSIFISMVFILVLITVDEIIKWAIKNFNSSAIDNCTGSKSLIHYHPIFNEGGSFLNLKLKLEHNRIVFFAVTVVGIVLAIVLYIYVLKMKQAYKSKYIVLVPPNFFLAATFGRLLERIFWEYTLDYIALKKIGVLDLIDVYLFFGCFGLIISFYFQHLESKNKR